MHRKVFLVAIVITSVLAAASPVAAAPDTWGAPGNHQVRPGETLFSIGRLYGVDPWAIASVNHLPDPNKIYIGQWLYIPEGYARSDYYAYPRTRYGFYHCVTFGQTLYSIGRMYGLSPWTIAAANGIYNLNQIYAGQRLFIPRYS